MNDLPSNELLLTVEGHCLIGSSISDRAMDLEFEGYIGIIVAMARFLLRYNQDI